MPLNAVTLSMENGVDFPMFFYVAKNHHTDWKSWSSWGIDRFSEPFESL